MIKLFNYKENNFNSNGIATIKPLTLMEYKEESLNGWHIETELPIKYNDLIEEGMIALVETKSKGAQPFLISNITKTTKTLHFIAKHYIFDAINYVLEDVRPTNMSAAGALKYINDRTDIKSPFTTNSNVSSTNTAYFINKNMLEALDTIQERWGGVYDVDKFHINLKNKVGIDRGDTILYGKNLEGLKVYEDWSNVVTKLLPVGFDGLLLPEKYLYSKNDYGKPYTKVIKFETELEDEDRTEENLLAELRVNAEHYLKENEVPKLSYEVESNINQELGIGDTIHVKHPVVDILTEVIAYEYNVLTKRITKLTFGNYKRNVKKKVDAIKESIKEVAQKANDFEVIIGDQTNLINDMNKKGHVFIDDNQIMVLDKIPKETAKHVWRWNMGGLGYSENGIEGPFKQAWTIDGTFNTDFIAANSIMTNQLHSSVGSSLDISSNKSLNLISNEINIVAAEMRNKADIGENLIKGSDKSLIGPEQLEWNAWFGGMSQEYETSREFFKQSKGTFNISALVTGYNLTEISIGDPKFLGIVLEITDLRGDVRYERVNVNDFRDHEKTLISKNIELDIENIHSVKFTLSSLVRGDAIVIEKPMLVKGNKRPDKWSLAQDDELVSSDGIVGVINATPEELKISWKKMTLEGFITANKNFWIDEEGNAGMKNATISGTVGKLNFDESSLIPFDTPVYTGIRMKNDGKRKLLFGVNVPRGGTAVLDIGSSSKHINIIIEDDGIGEGLMMFGMGRRMVGGIMQGEDATLRKDMLVVKADVLDVSGIKYQGEYRPMYVDGSGYVRVEKSSGGK